MGIHPRRTWIGIGFVAVLSMTVLMATLGPRVLLFDGGNRHLAPPLDHLVTIEIFLAVLTNPAGPLYALWNGGPALGFAIPLVPIAIGSAVTGGVSVGIDLGIALSFSAAGAVIGTYRTVWFDAGSTQTNPPCGAGRSAGRERTRYGSVAIGPVDVGYSLGVFATSIAFVTLWRLHGSVGPYAQSGLWTAWLVLGVTCVGLLALTAALLGADPLTRWRSTGSGEPPTGP